MFLLNDITKTSPNTTKEALAITAIEQVGLDFLSICLTKLKRIVGYNREAMVNCYLL
jgi:hypothetical protein